jgi:hypothetical protein
MRFSFRFSLGIFSTAEFIAPNISMIDYTWIRNDLEGNVHEIIEFLSQNFPEITEEIARNLSGYPGHDSKQAPREYQCRDWDLCAYNLTQLSIKLHSF